MFVGHYTPVEGFRRFPLADRHCIRYSVEGAALYSTTASQAHSKEDFLSSNVLFLSDASTFVIYPVQIFSSFISRYLLFDLPVTVFPSQFF